jgi:hypothetical protein
MSVSLASSLVLLMMNSISNSVRGRAFVVVNQPAEDGRRRRPPAGPALKASGEGSNARRERHGLGCSLGPPECCTGRVGSLIRGGESQTLTAGARPPLPPPARELSLRDAFQSTEDS